MGGYPFLPLRQTVPFLGAASAESPPVLHAPHALENLILHEPALLHQLLQIGDGSHKLALRHELVTFLNGTSVFAQLLLLFLTLL